MSVTWDFHGPHSGPRQTEADRIEWCEPSPRFCRVRILRHTCQCKACVYEFCVSAGLAWVRRTDRSGVASTVRESRPASYAEAEKLWERILTGEAV